MIKKSYPNFFRCTTWFLFVIGFWGCTLFQDPDVLRQQQETVDQKKQHYQALYDFVTSAKTPQHLTIQQVRGLYGEPDDIFRSGSAGSQLEIWTYEKVAAIESEELWGTIRLYFNNGRLMSWKF